MEDFTTISHAGMLKMTIRYLFMLAGFQLLEQAAYTLYEVVSIGNGSKCNGVNLDPVQDCC